MGAGYPLVGNGALPPQVAGAWQTIIGAYNAIAAGDPAVAGWYNMVGGDAPPPQGVYRDPNGASGGGQHLRHHHGQHGPYANAMAAAAAQYGISPRAIMVPAPEAQQAQRQTLPMNTGGSVVTTTVAALITSRPQRQAFRPERVFVSNASSPSSVLGAGGAADWLLNDISIGNRSQYVQAGSLPGDIFQSTAIDSYVTFETAQTAMDVTMSVTYNGTGTTSDVNGLPFWGSIHGTAAV